jgi:hypothetical protein
MSVELRWQEKDKILLTTYSGPVTTHELTDIIQTIISKLNTAEETVHVIVDWRQATDYPFFADFMFPGLKLLRHPRMGWLALVGESKTVKLWVDLFSHIESIHFKIFRDVEEAVQFLQTIVTT